MKKICLIVLCCCLVVGCGLSSGDVLKNFSNKLEKASGYYLEGTMEIINNEDIYEYDVMVTYLKDDFYKVELTNVSNDHKQIILKNDDGVYVVTPNLNKSFKFQSDWPYNNSQVYLIDSIVSDLSNEKDLKYTETDGEFVYTSAVNYPNNTSLVKQKVYFDKNANLTKVQVVDEDDVVQIQMDFSKVDLGAQFDDDYFDLDQVIQIDKNGDESNNELKETATIDDIIYPMYLPTNTYLTDQQTIDTDNGQRLILTFDGDSPFILVEEVSSYEYDGLIIPVSGEIDFVADSLAVISPNSITWNSGGIDYYVASDVLSVAEMLNIARSISTLPVSK